MQYQKLNKNFTQIDNSFFESLFSSRLTKNEISILAVIFRASYMCQRDFCDLKPSELTTFGTRISHYKTTLSKLEDKGVIRKEKNDSLYRFTINEEKIMKLANINHEYLKEMLSRNCPKKGRDCHEKCKSEVPIKGSNDTFISHNKSENSVSKDKEIHLNNIEREKINKLIRFLKDQGHAYAYNYIMSLVKKYGVKPVTKLLDNNISKYQWNEYLEYYSKKYK